MWMPLSEEVVLVLWNSGLQLRWLTNLVVSRGICTVHNKNRVLWIVGSGSFGQDEHEGSQIQIQRYMYKVYEIGEVTYSNQTTSENIYSTIYREMCISKWHTIP